MPERLSVKHYFTLLLIVVVWPITEAVAVAQTTAFSYQGRLTDAGNPADGLFDMQFKLFNTVDVGTGTQQGPTLTNSAVQVTKGVFNIQLDFGAVFDGSARFLEISLRPTGSPAPRTMLSPRQMITSAPYALHSLTAANAMQLSGLNPSSFVQFNGSGNVGIGTPTPQTKLEVLTATNNYGFTHTDGTIRLNSFVGPGQAGTTGGWFGTQSNHPLHFYTSNGEPRMTIGTNGNVGIGTSNPLSAKLEVQAFGSGIMHTNGTITINTFLDTQNGGGFGTLSNHPLFFFTNSNVPKMTIDTAGNVGIGTTNPFRLLHVNGRARIGFIPLEVSAASVCFNAAGDLLQCGASSFRLKTNVKPFGGGLDIVRRLRPISFNWKEDGRPDIGLGAEDVAQVAPSLTFTNSEGEVTGVKYERLNILLINAFKEQQAQIEKQNRQIKKQQMQIERQQREIDELREAVNALRTKARARSLRRR